MASRDDIIRKRLVFIAERRSMSEMEQLLSRFLAGQLDQLTDEACERMILLLQQSDLDLLDWLSGFREPPVGVDREVLGWMAGYRTVSQTPSVLFS